MKVENFLKMLKTKMHKEKFNQQRKIIQNWLEIEMKVKTP